MVRSIGFALLPYGVFWIAFMAFSLAYLSAAGSSASGGFPTVALLQTVVNLATLLPIVMAVRATLQHRTTLDRLRVVVFGTVTALVVVNGGVLAYLAWQVY